MFNLLISFALLSVATDAVYGKYVYRQSINGWIKAHHFVATWEEAYAKCWSEGYATVASPNTKELRKEMEELIGKTPYFIGATSTFYPGERFVSIEGVDVVDMPVSDLLGALDPKENGCLSFDGQEIKVVSCTARLPYICYKKLTKLITNNVCGVSNDVSGYEYQFATNQCYKLHKQAVGWNTSYITCQNEGAYLSIIDNEAEAKFLTDFAFKQLNAEEHKFVSVGMRAKEGKGDWLSIQGNLVEEIYNEWVTPTKPATDKYRCGRLAQTGKLDEGICNYLRPFLCEKSPKNSLFPFPWAAGTEVPYYGPEGELLGTVVPVQAVPEKIE